MNKSRKLEPQKTTREGWEEMFSLMAENNDDQLLDDPFPSKFDIEEWTWDES